jgi:ABC-type sugar transport system substrate-binding protein
MSLAFGSQKSEGAMSIRRTILRFMRLAGAVMLAAVLIQAIMSLPAAAQSDADKFNFYIPLTKEFFEAMEKLSRSNANTYGDRQEPLLEQIALSSHFMVKTNLTLIKQNERIIHLLEELNRKRLLQEK